MKKKGETRFKQTKINIPNLGHGLIKKQNHKNSNVHINVLTNNIPENHQMMLLTISELHYEYFLFIYNDT